MISDPLGDDETKVIAPSDGIIIGRSNLPLAHEGDALFNLGTFRNMPKASSAVESLDPTPTA
jgi:predicted deacylase